MFRVTRTLKFLVRLVDGAIRFVVKIHAEYYSMEEGYGCYALFGVLITIPFLNHAIELNPVAGILLLWLGSWLIPIVFFSVVIPVGLLYEAYKFLRNWAYAEEKKKKRSGDEEEYKMEEDDFPTEVVDVETLGNLLSQ